MSLDNLREYARRCATDGDLLDRAREIGPTDVEEHMRHAESLGLDWDRTDLLEFRKGMINAEGEVEDLTEAELEEVAAGAFSVTMAVSVAVGAAVGAAVGGAAGAVAATAGGGAAAAAGGGGW